ncbi:hypothetical protein Tco_0058528, partial [Tanacetum coccineum]
SGYQQKDRKPSQNDKTEHGMEKTVQNQGQSPKMPKNLIRARQVVTAILRSLIFVPSETATTLIESNKPLVKDEDGVDVDVHIYRFHRHYPKASHLNASKNDFRIKLQGANWCCGQVLWIQNQMMDYGFNFMNTKIHIDNESTICIVKNPVYHSRTKHIEIRHHFIRDCYEKRLIDVVKIHTDNNVADLLTKGFDVTRFNFLVLELILLGNNMDLRMDGSCASNFSHIWVMTSLKYSDKHNMVAFLKKPNESVGFTEIVDFLKGTSLRYALTHNPTIYDFLVKQFWQTTTVRTLANGTPELVASIDKKEFTITEASIRSILQLADAAGISNLPDAKIYNGLATLVYVSKGKLTFWKKNFTPQWKFLIHTILHCLSPKSGGWDQFGSPIATALICLSSNRVYNFSKLIFDGMVHNIETNTKFLMYPRFLQMILGDYVPLLPVMLAGAAEDQGEGSAIPAEPQHTPTDPISSTSQPTIPSTNEPLPQPSPPRQLDRQDTEIPQSQGLDNGNIHKSLLRSHEAPLHEGHTSGSAEDSLQLKGIRYKRKTRSKSIEKDISTDLDADIEVNPGSEDFNTGNEDFNTGSLGVSTSSGPVSTPSVVQTINVIIPSPIKSQREGKAPMTTEEIQATKRTKAQIQQEEAGLAEAMRLQALQEEEAARQVHLDALLAKRISEEEELSEQQKKRKAEVQEAAQYYTEEDWDTIRAKLEANAELTKSLQGESMTSEDFAKRMVEMINQKKKFYAEQKAKARRSKPMTQAQQRDYMSTFIKNQSSWKLTQLKKLTFDELKTEFEKLVKSIENFVPMETDERVKRQGVQLEQEFSKKQKTIEEVSVLEESITEPVIAKEEEIEKSVKKRGKIRKQKARKGIHIDKTAQDESEEEREAFMKDKVTSASSESEIGIDAIPTATKPPSIVDWKIIPQSGLKAVYQIIRRDGSDKIYMSFGAILKDFSRDDLTELYRLVIKKYGANRPEEMYDRVLWGDLKTMFDPPL